MLDLLESFPSFLTNTTGGERMTKIRVHEYAKLVKKTSKEVIDELGKINVNVTNHMSTIDNDVVSKLDKSFGGNKDKQRNTKNATSSKPAKQRQSGIGRTNRPATGGQESSGFNRWTESSSIKGGQNRPAQQGGQESSSVNRRTVTSVQASTRRTESSSFNRRTESSSFKGGQNRPAQGGQNRPASTGGQNRPAQQAQGGQARPAQGQRRTESSSSTGGPSRPAQQVAAGSASRPTGGRARSSSPWWTSTSTWY